MEWGTQTSRSGQERRTPLRLSGQFHRERPESLRRLHGQSKTCCSHPEWRSDQGPRVRLLINYEEIKNEFSFEIIWANHCCPHHCVGTGWRWFLVAPLKQTGNGQGRKTIRQRRHPA